METDSEKLNPPLSSGYDRSEILVEDDGEDRCGKGRVGEIIDGPTEDLPFLNRHVNPEGQMGRWGDI